MKPMTISFLITLSLMGWIVWHEPYLWLFALTSVMFSGAAMVQADAISVLVRKIHTQGMLLELAKLSIDAANEALKDVVEAEKKKEAVS